MIDQEPTRTIYADFDGVIFPHYHKSDGGRIQLEKDGPYYLRSELQPGLAVAEPNKGELYYPAITQRLGELVKRGVQIIPASSRSIDLLHLYPAIANDLGGVDRYLVIDTFSPTNIAHKARAVSNNWRGVTDDSDEQRGAERYRAGEHLERIETAPPIAKPAGSRAVWIDDGADPERIRSVEGIDLLDDPSLKIIRPLGMVGLTMADLDEIEAFLFDE